MKRLLVLALAVVASTAFVATAQSATIVPFLSRLESVLKRQGRRGRV